MPLKPLFAGASALILMACQGAVETDTTTTPSQASTSAKTLFDYSFENVLSCVPEDSAMIAAHRGVSRAWDIPENSLEGLERLIDAGTLIAELDIAGLITGEQILFHDGVWERKSTGTGPVASTTLEQRDQILLKSFAGTLSAERPPFLEDALKLSKGKLFLEIDFKSSAKTDEVLRLIRDYDMADQVVLIAYTQERAQELHALAPEMLISAPGEDKGEGLAPEKTLLWMGRGVDEATEPTNTAGYIGLVSRDDNLEAKAKNAVFLVSDWSTDLPPIVGGADIDDVMACLNAKG
jgi:glycerophosphoryl diester phosphodiesterase